MYKDDLSLLCCPASRQALDLRAVSSEDVDGEILEGELFSPATGKVYKIINGIPRFIAESEYNGSWEYKWTQIDCGRGLNYSIVDKSDPAYQMHDIFDRNGYDDKAFQHARDGIALDIGCGVGQYSWRMLREFAPAKMVSLDLTGGVDVFRKVMLERFPEFKSRLLIVQASVFEMPFRDETFDYVFSLGVLMHTGNTLKAIRQAARVTKEGGELNFWVYSALPVHLDIREEGRVVPYRLGSFLPTHFLLMWVMLQVKLFRRLPHPIVIFLLRIFSSDIWYHLSRIPIAGIFFRLLFGSVLHPDHDYRFINNYDGWRNTWADTWTEQELFPTLREANIVIKGISAWQTGIWGKKVIGFYD